MLPLKLIRHPLVRTTFSSARRQILRTYCEDPTQKPPKYKTFKDADATEILDVHEERLKFAAAVEREERLSLDESVVEKVKELNVDELVDLIKKNKGEDLIALRLPPELKYVEYLLITTGRSQRHIQSLGETIRKYAKTRLDDVKNFPQLEGSDSEWIALDLGSICIHIMSRKLREAYDLDSLWGVGPKYDLKLHQQDEKVLALLKKHTFSSFGAQQSKSSRGTL